MNVAITTLAPSRVSQDSFKKLAGSEYIYVYILYMVLLWVNRRLGRSMYGELRRGRSAWTRFQSELDQLSGVRLILPFQQRQTLAR